MNRMAIVFRRKVLSATYQRPKLAGIEQGLVSHYVNPKTPDERDEEEQEQHDLFSQFTFSHVPTFSVIS